MAIKTKEIFALKLGCTQIYNAEGEQLGVTVLRMLPSTALSIGTNKNKIRTGFYDVEKKDLNKAFQGTFKGIEKGSKYIRELTPVKVEEFTYPSPVVLDLKENDRIQAHGVSKGKGFQGVMKKFNFAGMFKSHGAGPVHRSGGSIGMRATPGRVFLGRKMAGHLGDKNKCTKNLKVVKVDNDLVFVYGAVPGSRGNLIKIERVSE